MPVLKALPCEASVEFCSIGYVVDLDTSIELHRPGE